MFTKTSAPGEFSTPVCFILEGLESDEPVKGREENLFKRIERPYHRYGSIGQNIHASVRRRYARWCVARRPTVFSPGVGSLVAGVAFDVIDHAIVLIARRAQTVMDR